MTSKPLLFTLVVCAAMFAGCADTPQAATGASIAPTATGSAPGGGTIEGVVVSDESAPITNAAVAVTKPATLEARTDEAGAFRFEGLAAGEYTLFVTALGYEDAAKRFVVASGETTQARIVLNSIVVRSAYTTLFVDDFYWACAVSGFGTGNACYYYTGTSLQEKHVVAHKSEPGLIAAVASVQWTPNQYLGAKRTGVSAWDSGQKTFSTNVSFSPVTTRLLFEEEKTGKNEITTWNYFGSYCNTGNVPNCASDPPHSIIQIVIDQRFKGYTTQFYVDPPPDGFTGVPK